MAIFQCKVCRHNLPFVFRWDNKINEQLLCANCNSTIPVMQGIPVYLPKEDFDRVEEFQKIYENSTHDDPWQYDQSAVEHLRFDFLRQYLSENHSKVKRILDMGCSGGHLLKHLDELPFEEYFAFDISYSAIQKAGKTIRDFDFKKKRVTLFVANATDLPIQDQSFDLILCVDGIIGWELKDGQKQKVFSEIQRLLKPGGTILFVDYISKTKTAHLYPQVFEKLPLEHVNTVPIYDRLGYEFESAIKALLRFQFFRKWKNNLTFARALSKLGPFFGKHGAKHWAYVAKKPSLKWDNFALSFFLLSC